MRHITVGEVDEVRRSGALIWRCVDVRSATEYAAGHVPGAMNIPLEQIEVRLGDLGLREPVILICQSGMRARLAAGLLKQCRENVLVLEGGTAAWSNAGLPLVVNGKTRWSLERQVRLGAGMTVLAGVVLAATANFHWIYLAGIVGLGLTFAGLTDICGMGMLLARTPWNRARAPEPPASNPGTEAKAAGANFGQ